MAGFFGIFGNKTKYIDEIDTKAESEEATNNGAFYLTPDEAKTFGNIEFMRSPLKGKKMAEGGKERLTEIKNEYLSSNNGSANSAATNKADSNLEMFRNMAKQIKKS